MTLAAALAELESCQRLRITQAAVAAWRWRTAGGRPYCRVLVRRGRTETLGAMLVRAARLAAAGHVPRRSRRPVERHGPCACGRGLAVRAVAGAGRMCGRCARQWALAARDDMGGAPGTEM